jgi:hypothetical protein
MRIIAFITDPAAARGILAHLAAPPPAAHDPGQARAGSRQARDPPLAEPRPMPSPRRHGAQRPLAISASPRSGHLKARYGAPVGASWRWICSP